MPSLGWYLNRLKAMPPAELGWRAMDAGRDAADRWRFASGRYPTAADAGPARPDVDPPFRVSDLAVGAWNGRADELIASWRTALVAEADLLAARRLTFFSLEARDAGNPIDWNRDLESGRGTPLSFAPGIDYRDAATAGDAKVVWEPSRHQHFVVLGRAYRATGDERFAEAVIDQLVSWLDQSPFGTG